MREYYVRKASWQEGSFALAFTMGEIYIFLVKLKSFLKEADLEICLSNVNLRIVKNRIFLQLRFVVVSTI